MNAGSDDQTGFVAENPFQLPAYPYDQLGALKELADSHPGGGIDLSVGTPCDPPPQFVVAALGSSGAERGYPSSVGSPAFKEAASGWVQRRFGVALEDDELAACVGTKEFVASAAWLLRLRRPDRDTVLYPAVSYPTYAFGAKVAGCRAVGVPETAGGKMDLSAISTSDAARALVLWVNTPSNPTGANTDLASAAEWARAYEVPVFSDECYAEFTWSTWPPPTILQHGRVGLVALHSLSKRSNLAGIRAGFYAGDRDLVGYLSELRKHAGLMVPGPVQAAAAAAFGEDEHVYKQREVYSKRLVRLAEIFASVGLSAPTPGGGFYLWVRSQPTSALSGAPSVRKTGASTETQRHDVAGYDGGWRLAEELARCAGMIVSPGSFYGEAGADFVRVAAVQPDDRIELAAKRLAENRSALELHISN
ncbi:MAG TPA: aminotransferase class I/II-fold pyridoxal phosphate-dependent enzyme [Acidimicrobiales bacterium]|nr:aminotransferase class I/II-fold pyridoxal phosphate-dependent enzyme [Acidimicrobiales bacterium]